MPGAFATRKPTPYGVHFGEMLSQQDHTSSCRGEQTFMSRGAEMTVVRAAVTQVEWTGDKESMIAKHEELAREAAADGVQVIGFQELFYGPYFGIIQDQNCLL